MKRYDFNKIQIIRDIIVHPKTLQESNLVTLEQRQAFNELLKEIWQALLNSIENPIRQFKNKHYLIVEVLGALRFYINHSTGEIQLRVRVRPGNTQAAFVNYSDNYNIDLPLYDTNIVIEAFVASWNKQILQLGSNFVGSNPMEGAGLRALFGGAGTLHFQLTSSIRKVIKQKVFWHNFRHLVRDELKLNTETTSIARRARAESGVKNQPSLRIYQYNNVIKHIEGYQQLDKEVPNLLWLYTIALEEKIIPKGKLVPALKKLIIDHSGCTEKDWQIIINSNARDFTPVFESSSFQWDSLVEYIKLQNNQVQINQIIENKHK